MGKYGSSRRATANDSAIPDSSEAALDRLTRQQYAVGVAWLISLTPFLGTLWFWKKFAVNAPVMDQWSLPWLFAAAKSWRALCANLLTAHLEHPIVFPKLIWLVSGFATKWDTRVDAAISVFVTLGMFTAIISMAAPRIGDPLTLLGLAGASFVVFSFVHYDTWLWGWMLVCVLANASFVIAVLVTRSLRSRPLSRLVIAK